MRRMHLSYITQSLGFHSSGDDIESYLAFKSGTFYMYKGHSL